MLPRFANYSILEILSSEPLTVCKESFQKVQGLLLMSEGHYRRKGQMTVKSPTSPKKIHLKTIVLTGLVSHENFRTLFRPRYLQSHR